MRNPAPLITNTALRVPCRLSRYMFNKFAVHFPTLFSTGSIGCDESISSQVQDCGKQPCKPNQIINKSNRDKSKDRDKRI